MRFIDKTSNAAQGQALVDCLLNAAWSSTENRYLGADYEGLSQTAYRDKIKPILLNEQNNCCCYCMKHVKNDKHTTLEHIIPHHISEEDYALYSHPIFDNNAIHLKQFDRNSRIIPPARYPHDICYHNLLASCSSNTHCNHFRGNERIKPLIYDEDLAQKIAYDEKGLVYSEEYLDDLEVLGLSIDRKLEHIRRIWAKIAQSIETLDELTDEKLNEIILDLVGSEEEPASIEILTTFFGSPSQTTELLAYG